MTRIYFQELPEILPINIMLVVHYGMTCQDLAWQLNLDTKGNLNMWSFGWDAASNKMKVPLMRKKYTGRQLESLVHGKSFLIKH